MNRRLIWNFEFLPQKALPLPETENKSDDLKWEIRFFWPEDRIISLYNTDNALLDITNYQQKHKVDCYYLLPDSNYNIKIRRNQLLYKPVQDHSINAIGFGAKINLDALSDYPNLEPATTLHLQQIVQQTQKEGKKIYVNKECFIYKFATTPKVKLELARLEVNNQIFFSVCIEGKSLYLVETIYENLLDEQDSCDYVTFLKSIIKS